MPGITIHPGCAAARAIAAAAKRFHLGAVRLIRQAWRPCGGAAL